MSTSPFPVAHDAGQTSWTRDLARDLFPAAVLPFHKTLLRRPVQAAMQRAWAGLGAIVPSDDFWRWGEDGRIDLNASLVARAGRALHGAAYIGAPPEEERGGVLARWQARETVKRARKQIDAVVSGAEGQNQRFADWQARARRLHWSQADLLQVMEELEPHAEAILAAYFTLRAGLSAAHAEAAGWLAEAAPGYPAELSLHLYSGLEGLPSVEAAYALADLRRDADSSDALTAFGHRGPGEARPDARRWHDRIARSLHLPEAPLRDAASARALRREAEEALWARLDREGRRQVEPMLARARNLCRAVDLAWDGFVRVMAVAQAWAQMTATEALAAGLIAALTDVLFLEFEELKQIATGEWHHGRSEQVREEVMRRQAKWAAYPAPLPRPPCPASPGKASGPLFRVETAQDSAPPAGAVLLADVADPGCAPYWLAAAAVLDGAGDPWTPGMIVARSLGVPAVSGISHALWQAPDGQVVTVDGGAGVV